MTDASERERLVADLNFYGRHNPLNVKAADMLRADAETEKERDLWRNRCMAAVSLLPDEMRVGELQEAAKQLAAQSAELERLRNKLAELTTAAKGVARMSGRTTRERDVLTALDKALHFPPYEIAKAQWDAALATPSAAGGEKEG